MVLRLDLAGETPLYRQLYDAVVEGIAGGGLCAGEQLPPVRQVAVDAGINMHTVSKAYQMLRDDGYVVMGRRSGAVVAPRRQADAEALAVLQADLSRSAASAVSRSIPWEQFLSLCKQAYEAYEGGNTHE